MLAIGYSTTPIFLQAIKYFLLYNKMNVNGGSGEYSKAYFVNATVNEEVRANSLNVTNATMYRFSHGLPVSVGLTTTPQVCVSMVPGEIGLLYAGRLSAGSLYQNTTAYYSYVGGVGRITTILTNSSGTPATLSVSGSDILAAMSTGTGTYSFFKLRFN